MTRIAVNRRVRSGSWEESSKSGGLARHIGAGQTVMGVASIRAEVQKQKEHVMTSNRIATFTAAFCTIALAPMIQGCHCDKDMCERLGRYGERFALNAQTCCGLASTEAQDACVQQLLGRMDNAENLLEQLDAACRAGNQEVINRLLERLAGIVGNVVIASANGQPANALPVLRTTDTVQFNMNWRKSDTAIATTSLASVDDTIGLSASAGPRAIQLGTPVSIIAVDESSAANGIEIERWELNHGSVVIANIAGLPVDVQVSGTVEFSVAVLPLSAGPARLPTGADLLLRWGEQRVRLALDETCPWNRVTSSHLMMGLRPACIDERLHAELKAYPTIFVTLPFHMSAQGSATSSTGGSVAGTEIFPSYFGALAGGAFDTTGAANCGDADGDGVTNLAERIRKSYETRIANQCGSQGGN